MTKKNEKHLQESKKELDTKLSVSYVKEANNLNSSGSDNQTEELIQRDEVENTPFVMITINNETFGTFGKYRITEIYHTKQQCAVELKRMDWNRVIQITSLLIEMINETKKHN